jgi:hypothetical protein
MPLWDEPTNMNPIALLKQSDVQFHLECGYLRSAERGYNCQTIKDAMAKGTPILVSLCVLVLLAASLLGPSLARTQDLAEAARKEKDRRAKAQAAGPATSYSTEDLASFHANQRRPPASEWVRVEVPQQRQTSKEWEREEQTERYWQRRLFQSRDRVRSAYDGCTSQFYKRGIRDFGLNATVRGELIRAIQAQEVLEDEARKAGVQPGWVRFDWSNYPRLSVPAPGAKTGSLTIPHPCSVQDIRDSMGLR